jgi:translation elongation factor P/translation initiation factor 5A
MKKLAKDLVVGDSIKVAGKVLQVKEVEVSEMGKQGKAKVRMVVSDGVEKTVMIRPDDYPFETSK